MINRHSNRCCNYNQTCNCGVAHNDPHWLKRKLAIVEACQTAFNQCKHHTNFTKRLEPFFEKALPGYSVIVAHDGSYYKVSVQGGRVPKIGEGPEELPGLAWDDKVELSLYNGANNIAKQFLSPSYDDRGWAARFQDLINRARQSLQDQLSAIALEDRLSDKLDILKAGVEAIRSEAAAMIDSPSNDLRKAYPELF